MADIRYLRDDIAIVGWSCRLPGANSIEALWSLLIDGRCAVSAVPPDRFSLERYGHPRRRERGKSYTWAAGILDDAWGFDPSVFGISPREAEQMDPQQRILLQLTWEALEDAGIRPSSLARTEVGVFVGASQTDYAHAVYGDQAIADSHFATGNALAILANRISYIYDLRGPSVTVDTACSSSLVALHQAVEALRSGRIDTAIVGGINIIGSPAEFISFSQAAMLSPSGLCRAFSADADGYVRAEGGAVLVLRHAGAAGSSPVHGLIVASDVNSDGRTNGISLPSEEGQEALLRRVYARAGIDPDRLAFVEAHGTGTPVGDPIEARALGRSIGAARSSKLPIGSIKSNIGHVEAASGLAGLLKALLALNHGLLPRSLHVAEPNPAIDFDQLNLTVCRESLLLPNSGQGCAGVSSFGFGGTNAHVVVAAGKKRAPIRQPTGAAFLCLSAASKAGLAALARKYLDHIAPLTDAETESLATAVAHRRERLGTALAISTTRQRDVAEALNAFVAGAEHPRLTWGQAAGHDLPIAFVYSGNGSQWPGMGMAAYRHNDDFRRHFDHLDDYFRRLAAWSLTEALRDERLAERLPFTRIAQPLIFAIQSAVTAALRARGLRPAAVLGHSVGEVAAAEAAGILDPHTALDVIHYRSTHQELVRGAGRMAALLAAPSLVEELLDEIEGVAIAAHNGPQATTVSGSAESLLRLKQLARGRAVPFLDLDLDYPFHTGLMAPVKEPLLADLKHIVPRDGAVPFVSTVTGSCLPGWRLGAEYWWRNVREPVRFAAGIRELSRVGARYFIEIGPRSTLLKHIADSLAAEGHAFCGLSVLDRKEPDRDPINAAVAKALISGAQIDVDTIFGRDSDAPVALPTYQWQQQPFRYTPSAEAVGVAEAERHPFSGARLSRDGLQWFAHIDTALFPELADHKVGNQIIFPGAGFLEIVFAVAREWLQSPQVLIADFEIVKPLDLTNGETREIMSRVSPHSNTIEVFSRPRLSQAGWLLHCRGRARESDMRATLPQRSAAAAGATLSGEDLYRLAEACGLNYGPAFRLLTGVEMIGDSLIRATLAPGATKRNFVLDPMRVDSCSHGIITVFAEQRAEERGITYLPVRLEEAALLIPGAAPQRAIIEVVSRNDRAVVANYYFLGAHDELIAVLRGIRCQSVQLRRMEALEDNAFVELPQPIGGALLGAAGLPIGADALLGDMQARRLLPRIRKRGSAEEELIEGFAAAAAYEIACGLADQSFVDVEALVGAGRLAGELRPWLTALLRYLERAGLAHRREGGWLLIRDSLLPGAALVLRELARKYPRRAAELLLAGAVSGLVEEAKERHAIADGMARLPAAVRAFYDLAGVELQQASTVIERALECDSIWPRDRTLRVLQIGFGPLTPALLVLQRRRDFTLSVVETDPRRRDRAGQSLTDGRAAVLTAAEHIKAHGPFDVMIAAAGLHRLPSSIGLADLRDALAPRGLLLAVEPEPSLFRDLVFGLDPEWFAVLGSCHAAGGLQRADEWRAALQRAEFNNVHVRPMAFDGGRASLILGERGPETRAGAVTADAPAAADDASGFVILQDAPGRPAKRAAALERRLRRHGIKARVAAAPDGSASASASAAAIYFVGHPRKTAAVDLLTSYCLAMKACAESFGSRRARLWLVFEGALVSERSAIRPASAGAWAFSRTLANEFPHLDIRRIDVAPHTPQQTAAARVCDIIRSGTAETELQIDGATLRAVRAEIISGPLDRARAAEAAAPAARLARRLAGARRVQWEASERLAPRADEVEIKVEATGLNFRDVMWALALLPDDMIEGGVAGPTLGCECAGRIVRCGAEVGHLRPGDRVAAFAGSAFASHVTVPAAQVAKLPRNLSCEAGATIPVAFLTAYYALVAQAKLSRGEWVLIHGAAGGVGLAAIQIAQAKRACIIATAGSSAKRDFLKALGVPHVVDSRSAALADEIRAIAPGGVDIVLNSLAGEAMERSLACLKPFGRFVELGKRDYTKNTVIGLRPFRNNLTYFGVDIDQILLGRKGLGQKLFAALMRLFGAGALTPLPHSVFRACDVGEAFELMQRSEHIGKIVVQAPPSGLVRRPVKPFRVDPNRTHVITGGFGGFGLEAAKWLTDHGARHLVLIGRRGPASEEARAVVAALAERQVNVYPAACDVADRKALARVFARIRATMPPVAGILHAAMVLDDGLVANLDAQRFARVLAPKIAGAENLDALCSGMALDYFVLFSSATTLMGNPGQGNYVAANASMEALARRRRQQGLKALAIGWGPIVDVGVLATSERLRARFQKLTGVRGMRAAEALDLMAQALAQPAAPDLAVMTISPTEGLFTADRLPVLNSPTYARLAARGQKESVAAGNMDLHAIAQAEGIDGLRRRLTAVIVAGVARVLRTREADISLARPLGDIGLDSLMALEFAMNLEDTFGLHIALTSAIGSLTVGSLANEIIAQLNLEETAGSTMVKAIAEHHVNRPDPRELAILQEIVSSQEMTAETKKRGVLP